MGYRIVPKPNGWNLVWRVDRGAKGSTQKKLDPRSVGIDPLCSIEEARSKVAVLRSETELSEVRKQLRAETKQHLNSLIQSIYLPPDVVAEFEGNKLKSVSTKPNYWIDAKKIIAEMGVCPSEWRLGHQRLIHWVVERKRAPYALATYVRLLNAYGYQYCFKKGKQFIPIKLSKIDTKECKRAYQRSGRLKPWAALTEHDIKRARGILEPKKANWLAIALWFGLRPREVDKLHDEQGLDLGWYFLPCAHKVYKTALVIFQDKLDEEEVERRLCWKAVPACLPEQKALIPIILAHEFERPTYTDIKKLGPHATLRGPRRGFEQVMGDRGYKWFIYDLWVGHVSKDTQHQAYANKQRPYWEPPFK